MKAWQEFYRRQFAPPQHDAHVMAWSNEKMILRDEQERRDAFAAALAVASMQFPIKPEWSDCDREPWSKK
jgi:hypothetical protein